MISVGLIAGMVNGLGNWAVFACLEKGAKASVAIPLTALYPLCTVILATIFLKERPSALQWLGIALAVAAGAMLSYEPPPVTAPEERAAMSPVTVGIIGAGNVIWAYFQVLDRLIPRGLARMGPVCARRKETWQDLQNAPPGHQPGGGSQLRSCSRMWTSCSSSLLPKVIHCWYEWRWSMASRSWLRSPRRQLVAKLSNFPSLRKSVGCI